MTGEAGEENPSSKVASEIRFVASSYGNEDFLPETVYESFVKRFWSGNKEEREMLLKLSEDAMETLAVDRAVVNKLADFWDLYHDRVDEMERVDDLG